MNHSNSSRCVRALLALALLGTAAHALAQGAAPATMNVVIVDETERGWEKSVLDRHGIASRSSALNRGPHSEALRRALGDENVRLRLALPVGCPTQSTREACPSVRKVKDTELPDVIAETKGSTLLIVWPEAAYFAGEQLYLAYLDVDVMRNGKVVPGTFYVGYRDWECDVNCVPAAFEASAKELSAMVRYMLDMGPAAQSKSIPAAWLTKPVVTSNAKWSNSCATKLNKDRVIREYGERFWLSDPSNRTLTSAAWGGCNIFSAR